MRATPTRAPTNEARMRSGAFSPAEGGPDHDHHGHVAQPQPLFFPDELVRPVDEEQEPRSDDRPRRAPPMVRSSRKKA